MLIEHIIVEKIGKNGQSYKHNLYKIECDWCHKIFERRRSAKKDDKIFCSRSCLSLAVGNLPYYEESRKRRLADRDFAAEHKKAKETFLKRYGVDNPLKNKKILERVKATVLQRYKMSLSELGKKAFYEKSGLTTPFLLKEVVEKIDYDDVCAKARAGFEKKHSVKNPMHLFDVKEKVRATNMSFDVKSKRHKTMLERYGGYTTSVPENKLYDSLKELYVDVERQARVENWGVDFWIPSIKAAIQVDGVYWHGLDGLKHNDSLQSEAIEKTVKRDRRREIAFEQSKNDVFLIRITDVWINEKSKLGILTKAIEDEFKNGFKSRICKIGWRAADV